MTTARKIREAARQQMREAILDAAKEITVASGWRQLRMGAVAAKVGVSRQTLHSQFGTRDALGQAMILRETERFLDGVIECLSRHPGALGRAVTEAVHYTLDRASTDPLLRTILTSSRGGDDSLLPLLTTRSDPVVRAASASLDDFVSEHYPDLDPARVADVIDNVVRLTVSHMVLPVEPHARVARRLGQMVLNSLRVPEDDFELD